MRLDKYLADSGIGTRSEVKKIIAAGRVSVNGSPVRNSALQMAEEYSLVCLDGSPVQYAKYEYFMLNKPMGVISASRDPGKQDICVTDLIRETTRSDLFPVGRLDKDTEGLLLITNDGPLCHRLLSPRRLVDKTYFVRLDAPLDDAEAERLMAGTEIGDEKPTLPCRIEKHSDTSCTITIQEGRYHEIKRLFGTAGLTVTSLKRLSMGPLVLDPALQPGEYRRLTQEELDKLKNL